MQRQSRWVTIKKFLSQVLPGPLVQVVRSRRDQFACAAFLLDPRLGLSLSEKTRLINQLYVISSHVLGYHTQAEALAYLQAILSLPSSCHGVIVEAGCYKGGSTAKLSLAAAITGRKLVVFDSFQGITDHNELHRLSIFGNSVQFSKGEYGATLPEVMDSISAFGEIRACQFVAGWFSETLPHFHEPVAIVVLDVDLASSIRDCLRHLYPLIEPGGVLLSHDGHLPLVLDVFDDSAFWLNEVGCPKPDVSGFGRRKLLKIVKRAK